MAKEIERKFLVTSNEYKRDAINNQEVEQAYLRDKAECYVSLYGDSGRISVRGPTGWAWDVIIPQSEALEILQNPLDELTFRVRWTEHNGEWITIKGKSTEDGLTRDEWEYALNKGEYDDMVAKLNLRSVIKTRWYVDTLQVIIEVDEFGGDNEPLVVAEIEFTEDFDHSTLKLPDWVGEEVTGDVRYYNSSLIDNPYTKW